MLYENLLISLLMIAALDHAYLANNHQFRIFLETFCHAINERLSFASYYTDLPACIVYIAFVASKGLCDIVCG